MSSFNIITILGGGIFDAYALLQRIVNKLFSLTLSKRIKFAPDVHFQRPVELRGGDRISIGPKSYFHPFLELCAWKSYNGKNLDPTIRIGSGCSFGSYNHISCINGVIIGDNFLSGRSVTIIDNNHGDTTLKALQLPPLSRELTTKGQIIIGNNVWVGDKATILGGVHIGDGAVIAANSVVTKDLPPYCLAAGNPARIIKNLNT